MIQKHKKNWREEGLKIKSDKQRKEIEKNSEREREKKERERKRKREREREREREEGLEISRNTPDKERVIEMNRENISKKYRYHHTFYLMQSCLQVGFCTPKKNFFSSIS